MGNFIQGVQQRGLLYGNQVIKAAQTFPQGGPGTANLFTIAGGMVMVTSLIGVVTTVIAGTDPQLSLGLAPTIGTAQTSGIATTKALTSAEVGTLIAVYSSGGLATTLGVMTTAAKAGAAVFGELGKFVCPAGTITQTAQTAQTGAISWYLTYVPIDAGASVS